MRNIRLADRILGWVRQRFAEDHSALTARRGPRDHVIILDGTGSSLRAGEETNAGLTYRLLQESGSASLYYEAGIQWRGWRNTHEVILGRGINRQIRRAYGYLASRYRPGDRIILMGYSRGAYAARSMAGMIDRIGLLEAQHATERNIRQIYRLYRYAPEGRSAAAFRRQFCHEAAPIEMIGVWDTVKALGLRLPLLWRFIPPTHHFHNHEVGDSIRHAFHALAADETRIAFEPVLWTRQENWTGVMRQMWFRGAHGDIGGQLGGDLAARPLSNIPLVWMLENLETCAVGLPENWRERFPCDVSAKSVGTWKGISKLFVFRRSRKIGQDPSEELHDSVKPAEDQAGLGHSA